MMSVFTFCGLVAIALGAACLYVASPNQRLLVEPWPRRPARIGGAALLLAALPLLARDTRPLATAFVFVTALMLVLAVLPYLGALLHARRTR
ncbi:MAG: hypothetical protein QM674_09090 [Burkholderiaceae bacterium]